MPEAVQPVPRRFYWLKRLGIGFVVCLLLLVGLRLWWGHRANTRMNNLIEQIEARGEPIRYEDMLRDPVADQDNKAYYLRQVLAQWPTVPGQGVLVTDTDWYGDPDKHPDPITDNAAYLNDVRALLPLFEQADAATDSDWGVVIQSPAMNTSLPFLGTTRRLARLIRDAAQRAVDVGDTELALHLIDRIRIVADSLDHPPYIMISHLITISIDALEYGVIENQLPQLSISAERNDPTRIQAELLLARHLDEKPMQQKHIQTWLVERWYLYNTAQNIFTGQTPLSSQIGSNSLPSLIDSSLTIAIRPVLINDAVLEIEHTGIVADTAAQARDYPEFKRLYETQLHDRLGEDFYKQVEENILCHPITRTLSPVIEPRYKVYYQSLARRRMAATALAIKLYETDHGKRPDTLEQLVPDYLPAVPLDPLAGNGQKIRYRTDGSNLIGEFSQRGGSGGYGMYGGYMGSYGNYTYARLKTQGPAILYSVGTNGVDNGGTILLNDDGKVQAISTVEEDLDLGFLLDLPEESYPLDTVEDEPSEP